MSSGRPSQPTPTLPNEDEEAAPSWADRLSRGFEPVTARDWILLSLALVDVLLLVARDVYGGFLPSPADQAIVGVDLAILAIFAVEFLWELSHASKKIAYVRNHWYEVVGMIPIAHWGVRVFRFVRLVRMYVVWRYPEERQPDRDWSYALVRGLIVHYRNVLLEEITDPIVLASLDVIEEPLTRARHAEALGNSLREREEEIETIVQQHVANTKGLSHLAGTRYGQRLVRSITLATLEATVHTLESDELNEVVSASIQDVLDEVRGQVRRKSYAVHADSRFQPSFTE